MGAIYIAVSVVAGLRWPNPGQPLVGQVVESIITGVLFALAMSFFTWLQFNFALEVSPDLIGVRWAFFSRKLRKGEVKTVIETRPHLLAPPGLRISKYGPLLTRFWGGIWIPKALPEYDEIRNIALTWKRPVD